MTDAGEPRRSAKAGRWSATGCPLTLVGLAGGHPESSVLAAALFTVVGVIVQSFFRQMAIRSVPALLGSTALIATLVSLVVTSAVSDGLQISGGLTWILATVLVWGVSLIVRLLLPLIIFKRALSNISSRQG